MTLPAPPEKFEVKMTKEQNQFCNQHRLTEDQFYGKEEIGGSLDLSGLTSIPEGFNPTVGGSLGLSGLTSIPEGFNQRDYDNKDIPFLSWQKGKYIQVDGRFSEVISRKGNVWKLKDVGKDNRYFLVTDGNGKYAHGGTIKEAREDLIYKISNRDKSEFAGLPVDKKMPFQKAIEVYRVITGACAAGVKHFLVVKGITKKSFTIKEIGKVTAGQWGNETFCDFFNLQDQVPPDVF